MSTILQHRRIEHVLRATAIGLGLVIVFVSTPAVALTAFAREEDARRAFAAGFQMFVAKPIDPTGLAVAVAHLARREAQGQR